jgi:esterase/lipase superfamily enzyme
MEIQYFKEYSPSLDREMECKVYGHAGRPVLFIPCQDGRFFDFEDFKMADTWGPWIESGQVMVFSIDTIDKETWSNTNGDPRWRIERYEQWINYITDEMVPFIRSMVNERNGWSGFPGVITFGCSLGATHAVNLYLRRPDLFDGCLALSGIYTAEYGFGSYMDDLVYRNSPVHYMANLPMDHPYIDLYNDHHKCIICCGQGPWEQPATTFQLRDIMDAKGIRAWVDVWGYDCAHDWPWWYKQVAYFIPYLLED